MREGDKNGQTEGRKKRREGIGEENGKKDEREENESDL